MPASAILAQLTRQLERDNQVLKQAAIRKPPEPPTPPWQPEMLPPYAGQGDRLGPFFGQAASQALDFMGMTQQDPMMRAFQGFGEYERQGLDPLHAMITQGPPVGPDAWRSLMTGGLPIAQPIPVPGQGVDPRIAGHQQWEMKHPWADIALDVGVDPLNVIGGEPLLAAGRAAKGLVGRAGRGYVKGIQEGAEVLGEAPVRAEAKAFAAEGGEQAGKAAEQAAADAQVLFAATEFENQATAKLINIVKTAPKQRLGADLLQSQERSRRLAIQAGATQRNIAEGVREGAFDVGARATGGELPKAVFFKPPREVLTQPEIDSLFGQIARRWEETPQEFRYWDAHGTEAALTRALNGEIPTWRQIELLNEMFGPELGKNLWNRRHTWKKVVDQIFDIAAIPKSIRSSFDLSNAFRQSWFFTTNPRNYRETTGAMNAQVKAFAKERYALATDKVIQQHPLYDLAKNSKLQRLSVKPGVGDHRARPDLFLSKIAEHLPGIRQSQRAFVTFGNKMRHDMFYKYAQDMLDKGLTWEANGTEFMKLAETMNILSGLGNLGKLESLAPALGQVFWSPSLLAARIEAVPQILFRSPKAVRKQLMGSLVTSAMATTGLLSAIKFSGAGDVELDPRSADFGKLRVGNTRVDMWGGFQQYGVYIARLVASIPFLPPDKSGKASTTDSFYDTDPIALANNFIRGKLAPMPAFFLNWWMGENAIGEELADKTAAQHAWNDLAPFFIADMVEAIQHEGTKGIILGAPGIVGHGIQSYTGRKVPPRLFK